MLSIVWAWYDEHCFHDAAMIVMNLSLIAGLQTRKLVVSVTPMYGGTPCSSINMDYQPCYVRPCSDCSILSNGPNGDPCFNGGSCVDAAPFDGRFTCNCSTTGYIGDNCQTCLRACLVGYLTAWLIDRCPIVAGDCANPSGGPHEMLCLNQGTCVDTVPLDGHYNCSCDQIAFTGDNCQIRLLMLFDHDTFYQTSSLILIATVLRPLVPGQVIVALKTSTSIVVLIPRGLATSKQNVTLQVLIRRLICLPFDADAAA